jgi:hypothetical protein
MAFGVVFSHGVIIEATFPTVDKRGQAVAAFSQV